MIQSVDVSWPQQNYHPGAEAGVIVAATSGDTANGGLFTQATYAEDVANARAAGKEVGFYHFNGGTDPVGSARYFWAVIKNDLRPGDIVVLDVESYQSGTRPAVAPAWAAAFSAELARLRGMTPQQSRLGIYGNRSDMRAAGWGALEKSGSWLYLAAPGGYPENTTVGEWSHWTMLQYSSDGGIDRDESQSTFAQIAGSPAQPKEDDIMHFSEPWHTILWPNGHFSGYDVSIWTAVKYWYDNGTEIPGTEGTVVREMQTAIDTVAARAALIGSQSVAALDPAKIAAAVVAALPATPTVVPGGTVDTAALIAALEAALKSEFDAIPAAAKSGAQEAIAALVLKAS